MIAEALARLEVAILGLDRAGSDQRQAGLVGLQRRPVEVALVERGGKRGKRLGPGSRLRVSR